jgi:hypothetical protein
MMDVLTFGPWPDTVAMRLRIWPVERDATARGCVCVHDVPGDGTRTLVIFVPRPRPVVTHHSHPDPDE